MKRALVKFRRTGLGGFIYRHQKYIPLTFFIGGFIFDSLTLGRIDRLYDIIVLCLHMSLLTFTLCLYNFADDLRYQNAWFKKFDRYFPLAIQFFFGALSSAYVIYFSRSVSVSKTIAFFSILIGLLIANEFLKHRISNKYFQFGVYFFVNFTFMTFIIPVFIRDMNTEVFLFSGGASLIFTLSFITIIYQISPSTREEIRLGKMMGLVISIYGMINLFYLLKLIPPVPLALEHGIASHNIVKADNRYLVSYERVDWFIFWRDHRHTYIHNPGDNVYIFTSIFAPTDINKLIFHRWKWYDEDQGKWLIVEDIGYDITGGRDDGYRGYTYKNNLKAGNWKVEVITEEELILGVIAFNVIISTEAQPKRLITKRY